AVASATKRYVRENGDSTTRHRQSGSDPDNPEKPYRLYRLCVRVVPGGAVGRGRAGPGTGAGRRRSLTDGYPFADPVLRRPDARLSHPHGRRGRGRPHPEPDAVAWFRGGRTRLGRRPRTGRAGGGDRARAALRPGRVRRLRPP